MGGVLKVGTPTITNYENHRKMVVSWGFMVLLWDFMDDLSSFVHVYTTNYGKIHHANFNGRRWRTHELSTEPFSITMLVIITG